MPRKMSLTIPIQKGRKTVVLDLCMARQLLQLSALYTRLAAHWPAEPSTNSAPPAEWLQQVCTAAEQSRVSTHAHRAACSGNSGIFPRLQCCGFC